MRRRRTDIPSALRFSRQWWLDGLRTLFWVVILTAVIWVYADMEFTKTEPFRVKVRLIADANPDLMLKEDTEVEVTFKVSGGQRTLERFRDELNSRGPRIRYDVSAKYTTRDTGVPVGEMLDEALRPSEFGVSIESVSPAVIPMALDRRILTEPLEVEFSRKGASIVAGSLKITPARVRVYVPESEWEKVPAKLRKLRTEEQDLQGLAANGPVELKGVKIRPLVENLKVEPEEQSVSVSLSIDQRTGEPKTFTIPIRMSCPPGWTDDGTWQKFRLVRKDDPRWETAITVKGGKQDLEKLRTKDIRAHVELRNADKDGSQWTATVEIDLPDGIELDGPPPKVTYVLEPILPDGG